MNRNRIFTLILGCVAAALVATGCGGDDKAADKSPADAVTASLQKTSEVKSGSADIEGSISTGSLPGSIAVTGKAVFDTEATGGAAMDVDLSVSVAGTEQKFGFVAVDGKNYLTVGDKALEQKGANSQQLEPGQISSFISGISKYVTNAKNTGEADGLTTYTATVDVKKMITDNANDKEQTDLSKLSIPGVGSGQELQKAVSTADITVGVNSDGYAQELRIDMPLTISGNSGGIRVNITLSDIDQPVTVEAPTNVVDSASALGGLGSLLSGAN